MEPTFEEILRAHRTNADSSDKLFYMLVTYPEDEADIPSIRLEIKSATDDMLLLSPSQLGLKFSRCHRAEDQLPRFTPII